jgi:uncharacterized membrane protein
MTAKRILRRILGYFLRGLLFVVPIAIIIYVFYKLFFAIDGMLTKVFPNAVEFPGAGILAFLIVITLTGFIGSSFIAKPIINQFKKFLDKLPVLKTIYTSLNDLLSAFVGKKKGFNKPVLVKMNHDCDLEKPGFITEEDLHQLGIEGDKIAVYLPHSYNFSGNLYIVPRENITPVNGVKPGEFMKFIVSGGISHLEDERDKK